MLSNHLLTLFLSFLSGLLVAGMIVLVHNRWRHHLSLDHLEQTTGLPILGSIPAAPRFAEQSLSLSGIFAPQSALAEAYRLTATRLKLIDPPTTAQVLMVTSVKTGEGKSTVALNLAISYAQMGAKVLLIDTNLRRPSLHSLLKRSNQYGLIDYVVEASTLKQVTQPCSIASSAYVITTGALTMDALQAFSSQRFKELLSQARQHFDVTILDAPPVTGFADALLLASLADACVMVTHAKPLQRRALIAAVNELQRVDAHVLGFVIMQANAKQGALDEQYYAPYQSQKPALQSRSKRSGLNLAPGHAQRLIRRRGVTNAQSVINTSYKTRTPRQSNN